MKKVLMTTGIAILALATIVSAQSYTFSNNLTIGSRGADVETLQTYLIAHGYSIPSIESGAAAKGYFGSQTKTAVQKFQAANGVPATGFVGPLTRGVLNAGGVASAPSGTCPAGFVCTPTTPVAVTCPAGFVCTPVGGGTSVGGSTGITTPGVPGIMTVTSGPLSSSVVNVGQTKVPVLSARIQAQYSDLDVQSLTVDLGPSTAIYNKIFNTIYVTDGTNILASQPLNGNTVVQSGSDYIVGLAGFHFIVPKGTYKDIIIKADLNSSIDSTYTGSSSKVPGTVSIAGGTNNLTGWGVALAANSVRGVDGAGLNLYGPTTAIVQAMTINTSLVDTAQANISLNSATPQANTIPVTDTTNGQYLGLPVLAFDVNAQNDSLHLHEVRINIKQVATTCTSCSVTTAYLYQGSTQVANASVSGGVADFTNISNGTAGASIPRDQTVTYTVKVDVNGVTSGSLAVTASTSATQYIYNSIDSTVDLSGANTTQGYTQTVANAGPLFTLASTPTITKSDVTPGNASVSTFQYVARFDVNITAVGTSVDIGLPSSTTAAFGSSSMTMTSTDVAQVYQNGTATTSTQVLIPGYSQPTGTTLSSDTTYFTLARNQSITIPDRKSVV